MSPGRRTATAFCLALLLLPLVAGVSTAAASRTRVLDDFETLDGWETVASEGTRLAIASDSGFRGRGMRLDFDLRGGGYVNVRKTFDLPLPANYVFSFRLRGEAPANGFEFKVLDRSGRNVWWHTDRHLPFPRDWQQVKIRRSRLEFAWGPSGGTPLQHAGALEFTLTAATGGRGSVWIDDLRLVERDPPERYEALPVVTAASEATGSPAGAVLAGGGGWRSAPAPDVQWLQLDFGHVRELGGIVVSWDDADFATGYAVRSSEDGRRWRDWGPRRRRSGGRDFIAMHDADARYVRLDMAGSSRGRGFAIRAVDVRPFPFSATANHFFAAVAADAPRGWYPRYLRDEQTYWVPVGVAGDGHEALLSVDGAVELAEADFSIEPFLRVDDALLTWADGAASPSLLDGFLPLPTVTRTAAGLELTVTAIAAGKPGEAAAWLRYRVRNRRARPVAADLFLALRPFQVNPPWQSLRRPGGFAPIHSVRTRDGVLVVNDRTAVHLLTPANAVGAAAFADGPLVDALAQGRLPPDTETDDASGHASAAAHYELRLDPGASRDVIVAVPFPGTKFAPEDDVAPPQESFAARHAAARAAWERLTGRVQFSIPEPDAHLGRIARSTVAWILVNNDPPAIQPGSRTYARSWIRDGAETTAALVTSGAPADGAAFLRWFAGFQWPSGKIPCCVDARGRDPVPEHDSPGQFLFAVAEYYRYTRDIGLVADLWPNLVAAADYLTGLRAERLTPEFDAPARRLFRGLLPESISHEGYAAQPMHSYWDDFFAVRGFRDAAFLADLMGDAPRAQAWRATATAMATDVTASIARAMRKHGIDHVPGAAELGDFDANSTAIAVAPLGERALLPAPALEATFRRYLEHLDARLGGTADWTNYTPYELRNADALLRLGRPADALRILRAIVADQRPAAWNQWQEIVWRDAAAPRFIGDMPHTWIGAIYLRTLRSLFAWEDEDNDALVLGSGLDPAWIDAGVGVARLPTHHGTLSLDVRRLAADRVEVRVGGDVQAPAGGLLLRLPLAAPLQRVTVDGREIPPLDAATARIDRAPCVVVLEYGSGTP